MADYHMSHTGAELDLAISRVINDYKDTSDATAQASNIQSGFTAYAGGAKITGTHVCPPEPRLRSLSVAPTESDQRITPGAGYDGLSSVVVNAISSSYVGSAIDRRTSTNLTASGATVTAPAGYYASAATKTVASGTQGTPTASKGAVTNHAVSVTPSCTDTTGYITGTTKTGTPVTVTAAELVSGTKSVDENGTYDVTDFKNVEVNVLSTTDHRDLTNRDASDQHPMSAISGLQPALNRTDRSLSYLWKKSEGIIYDTETVHSNANTVTVPSGAMEYAAVDMVGGMSMRVDGVDHLIDSKVDKIRSRKANNTIIAEKTIPQSVIALCPDYGIGVNANCYNYIGLAVKKYHKRMGKVDLGTLDWAKENTTTTWGGAGWRFQSTPVTDIKTAETDVITFNAICSRYTSARPNDTYAGNIEKSISNNIGNSCIYIYDSTFTDAAAFKATLDGVYLYYELANEEIIDLSSVIPEDFEILPVEAGGTVQFHYPELDNGYLLNIPNDVTYMVNVAEVRA